MDLSTYTLPDLRRLQTRVESEIQRRSELTRRALLKQMQKMAAEQGLTLEDLIETPATRTTRRRAAAKPKKPSVIRFRNPANPEQGWSGHGRRPKWVLEWLEQGKALEELAV